MASTDVFPPYNLPDEAIPWGREAQKRILAGEQSELQLAQKVDNGLRATAGQLSALANQIADLSGRTSYSASDSATYNYNTTSANNIPGAQVAFELDRSRKVRLTFSAQMMANTSASGVNTAAGHMTFLLNGSEVPVSEVARGFVSASNIDNGYLHYSASANAIITLPAGTYTIMPRVTVTIIGTAAITATNSFLFVDVLEPA